MAAPFKILEYNMTRNGLLPYELAEVVAQIYATGIENYCELQEQEIIEIAVLLHSFRQDACEDEYPRVAADIRSNQRARQVADAAERLENELSDLLFHAHLKENIDRFCDEASVRESDAVSDPVFVVHAIKMVAEDLVEKTAQASAREREIQAKRTWLLKALDKLLCHAGISSEDRITGVKLLLPIARVDLSYTSIEARLAIQDKDCSDQRVR